MPPRAAASRAFAVDWGSLGPLRLKARALAEGLYSGAHRSVRKGAGVEFGGQRPYVPGDDLRFFDRRALLRHDRLMVREFETETDRALWLVVDATASMSYRSERAPGAKLAYAALMAATLARVALSSHDPVGLSFVGGASVHPVPAMSGREAFDRVVGVLEGAQAEGDATADAGAMERSLAPIARRARRGSVIVLLSDLLDLPPRAREAFLQLATGGRALVVSRVLDPAERDLDFQGTVRLKALEGGAVVEADPEVVRAGYQERLAAIGARWSEELSSRGGRFLEATTSASPSEAVRAVVQSIAEARR